MEEKQCIEELLGKIHIEVLDKDDNFRSFPDVIRELAQSWEALNDEYKNKLYEAMGIPPSKQTPNTNYPFEIRELYRCSSDASNTMEITYAKDTGIEYLKNKVTCRSEVQP